MKNNLSEIRVGDIFSEQSYFKVTKVNTDSIDFLHIYTGETVRLNNNYVSDILFTADQYQQEVTVGILDKIWTASQIKEEIKKNPAFNMKEGDLKQEGIKTVWSNVGTKPFTVCFVKQGKTLSNKAYETKVKQVIDNALREIDTAAKGKKGVAKTASEVIEELIRNPISNQEPGEERVLRGYKIQHESTDGYYQVVDLDITQGENKRLVNLNTIKWLVVGGVKYNVER